MFEDNSKGCAEEKVLEFKQGLGVEAINNPKESQESNLDYKVKRDEPEVQEGDLNTNYLELDTTDAEALFVSCSSTSTSEIVEDVETELDDI